MLGTRFLYWLQEIRLDGEAPARDYMTAPHVINLATASPVASRGRPAIRHDTEIPLSRQFLLCVLHEAETLLSRQFPNNVRRETEILLSRQFPLYVRHLPSQSVSGSARV